MCPTSVPSCTLDPCRVVQHERSNRASEAGKAVEQRFLLSRSSGTIQAYPTPPVRVCERRMYGLSRYNVKLRFWSIFATHRNTLNSAATLVQARWRSHRCRVVFTALRRGFLYVEAAARSVERYWAIRRSREGSKRQHTQMRHRTGKICLTTQHSDVRNPSIWWR